MNYWIFKVSSGSAYPDVAGRAYVYDNTHSVRVERGDEFLYLQKAGAKYGLTGAGSVSKVRRRRAVGDDCRKGRVVGIFTAELTDVVWFSPPLDLSKATKRGRTNRRVVGLPADLNRIGWSISMPKIDRDLFLTLLDAALDVQPSKRAARNASECADWHVDDSWSLVRSRARMHSFRTAVLERHRHTCVVCGTQLRSVLCAAHIRSYASDPGQRANPANGICLCSFCHTAFDLGEVLIKADGSLEIRSDVVDDIAWRHFTAVPACRRREWLDGVDVRLLRERHGAKAGFYHDDPLF